MIWDEQYLGGRPPKGGKAAGGFLEVFERYGPMKSEFRFGRFGLFSGSRLHTTWRFIKPLSDEIYAEGKTANFDTHVSELVTPPFEVKLGYVTFLLSGGNMPNEACINLLIDGKVVRTATGRNDDTLEWVAFDVKAFKGQQAQIQVLDTSTAAFGYITVDCICQSPDTKGAVRIIARPPSNTQKTVGRAETISGRLGGKPDIANGRLTLNGRAVDLKDLLLLDTGIKSAGDPSGKRVELVNGDVLPAEVLGLDEEKLAIKHGLFGEIEVALAAVEQAIFMPGPSAKADPGVLVHSNGNNIPGELLWIRDDNIAIKCRLGVIPLPRARVRSFVFSKAKPSTTTVDTVVLADGSKLSGSLTLDEKALVLTHDALGPVTLAITDVVRIERTISGVTPLTNLSGTTREQTGPIPPPAPVVVNSESGETLRVFPHTVVRYALPKAARSRRFRATLAPVANSRIPLTAHVRAGNNKKTYTVPPDSAGVDVDIDLGKSGEIEIIVDAPETVSFPCGIEWRNAFLVEGPQ
jgi:hypothetical protein